MLSAATKQYRNQTPLTVVRNLAMAGRTGAVIAPRKVVILECAPGPLEEFYGYDDEFDLVRGALNVACVPLHNLTPEGLEETLRREQPDVIHITGVDAHQAVELLGEAASEKLGVEKLRDVRDGVFLKGTQTAVTMVGAEAFAKVLTAAGNKPRLVTFNLYHSASRMAALTVAAGAREAIGFQDIFIDDDLTDNLFARFYHAWRESKYDTLQALREARTVVPPGNDLGSGIVLWTDRSLLPTSARPNDQPQGEDELSSRLSAERNKLLKAADLEQYPGGISGAIKVTFQPREEMNYALLHNNRGLFKTFTISKRLQGIVRGVNIDVELYLGETSYPFRTTVDLVDELKNLTEEIKVPLTARLISAIVEPVHTMLYANVSYGEHILYRNTHRVTLVPIDQWQDDDADGRWLPSFVMPRDPAIADIVAAAERYLVALVDDHQAGFDGYQHSPERAELQVQALWTTLVREYSLAYINPPPTYSRFAQRLRNPSQVLKGGRGTCIDLALLLASCLEFIEIYPVLFLLKGHAFVGYWRSLEDYRQFRLVQHPTSPSSSVEPVGAARDAWILRQSNFGELLKRIYARQLIPLEATGLAQRQGFAQAQEDGLENFRNQAEFDSMFDVLFAREKGVTPLPIGGSSQ
jgi:hypothetical protein